MKHWTFCYDDAAVCLLLLIILMLISSWCCWCDHIYAICCWSYVVDDILCYTLKSNMKQFVMMVQLFCYCCWCNQVKHYWIKHGTVCDDLAVWLSLLILINAAGSKLLITVTEIAHHKETIRSIAAKMTISPSKVDVNVVLWPDNRARHVRYHPEQYQALKSKGTLKWMIINCVWLKISILLTLI